MVVRSDFKDIAHYTTQVKVVDGVAKVTIPKLPDNLTTWKVVGYGYTVDGKVGSYEADFTVEQELALTPQVPAFLVDGDVVTLGVLVANNSATEQELNVKVDISRGNITGEMSQVVKIPSGISRLVSWQADFDISATTSGKVKIAFTAQ